MADISQYLQAIMSAVYGEDVRGSIHDAIALINDVGEAVLTLGTAVDSPTSPTTGFYQGSVYLNTATGDMWTCTGTGWSLSGNTKGDKGDSGLAATINVGTVTGGAVASVTNSGTTSAAVFDFVLPKGDKGDTGDGLTAESSHSGTNTTVNIINATTQQIVDSFNVPDGVPGATGVGIASIAKTATAGLVDTYTITYTDGTSTTFTVTNGADGQGAGDMTKVAYDPTNAVADAGGIPAYVAAHAGTTYTGEKGVIVAGTTIKAALVNDTPSALASQTISAAQNRQYAVNLDNNSKLSVNVPWENTTYNAATTSANGLMSSTDKSKLDGLNAVVANPEEDPTDDLTSIKIGSTVYRLQGGGGTTIVQIPSVVGDSFTYDGTAQGPTITGLDSIHCTVTGETAVNAGSYTLTIALNDPSSMVWSDLTNANKTYSYTIAKAPQTLTASKNSVSLTAQQPSDTVAISGQQGSLNVSSSDTGVATVSELSGVVTIMAVGNGSATVSVYAEETANYAQSSTITISVDAALVPNGKTVTPTDDIQTWLNCANIWDKTYTTINQVLADSTTLLALISSNNAADYMKRSTTWASAVTANSPAMTDIGSNDYCADTLLADATWLNAICNSAYIDSVLTVKIPTMSSDTTPSGVASSSSNATSDYLPWKAMNGQDPAAVQTSDDYNRWVSVGTSTVSNNQYIQYMFDDSMVIHEVAFKSRPKCRNNPDRPTLHDTPLDSDIKLQGSNDGTTFTDIATLNTLATNADVVYPYPIMNNVSYKYFRLQFADANVYHQNTYYCGLNMLQFRGRAA